MSTTKEYRIRELERQDARKAAKIKSLKAGIARVMTGAILLRNYTENWDGPGGTGPPPCAGNVTITATCSNAGVSTPVSGATVTATNGTLTFTGTTNGSGQYTFAPGVAGAWTFTSAKTAYSTYSGSFTFACANLAVAAPMVTANNTVTGTLQCSSQPGSFISGASVAIYSSNGGTLLGTATTNSSGFFSIAISGYPSQTAWLTYSAANYTSFAGNLLLSCSGTRALGSINVTPAAGKSCQCSNGLVADAATLNFTSSGYSVTLTYNGTDAAYVGSLTVNCRSITGIGCSKGTAAVTLRIVYRPSDCACFITFSRQGVTTPTCTATIGGFGGRDIPSSDAWCASISGLGSGACSGNAFYGNGTHSFAGATGYPYVATYSGVLFYDADGNPFLTNAIVSE